MSRTIYTVVTIFLLFTLISCSSDKKEDSLDVSYTLNPDDTVYEDAEDGNTSRWLKSWGYAIENVEGGANGSKRSIFVREDWLREDNGSLLTTEEGYNVNLAHYELPMENSRQFILEFDKKRAIIDPSYCFSVGVKVETKMGERHITFNTWFDQEKMEPIEQWLVEEKIKELVFPLSMEYVKDAGRWKRLRFDLTKYLHKFEPDNEIVKVISFYFQGGDDYLDNIRLVSK